MLGTEVVWHPGSQNGICVHTTNNDFYLLSTDWFTMKSFANLGKLINRLHDFLHLCSFILQLQELLPKTLTCINKMKEKRTERL